MFSDENEKGREVIPAEPPARPSAVASTAGQALPLAAAACAAVVVVAAAAAVIVAVAAAGVAAAVVGAAVAASEGENKAQNSAE